MNRVPAGVPTTFQNIYTPDGRIQTISGRAAALTFDDIPIAWRQPRIVHLAPVAGEVDPALAESFPGALLALTPQGWMRQWDGAGRVQYRRWPHAQRMLEQAQAVVLSIEDVRGDEALLREYAGKTRVLVVTRGARGCTLFVGGQTYDIPALDVAERDPTGAGDIFAAAFFARLHATGDPFGAARFATALAGDSVTRAGLDSIPSAETARRALQSQSGGKHA
jgi:sugar/nucleoside kinase (ribokinase family)